MSEPRQSGPAERPGSVEGDRLSSRLADLRRALADLVDAGHPAGAREILIERPAIEAEIWGLESQLAALAGDWKRAEACSRESARWQREARQATTFENARRLDELEQRLGLRSTLANRLTSLP